MTSPELPPNSDPPANVSPEAAFTEPLTDTTDVVSTLGALSLKPETHLKEHQQDAFTEIVDFFKGGGREGYVLHPTGTGKTVLFVELCQGLIETSRAAGTESRAIILVPKLDLVTQTIGSVDPVTGKRRGFKGFAPEIKARDVHGHVPDKIRAANVQEGEVLVTTYDSFRNLVREFMGAEKNKAVDWEAQKHFHEEEAAKAKQTVNQLTLERKNFVIEKFKTGEVRKARRFLATYNPDEDDLRPSWLSDQNFAALKRISEADIDDEARLQAYRRQLKKFVPAKLWRQQWDTKRKEYFFRPSTKPVDVADQSTSAQTLEEGADFSAFEKFAVPFIRRHSKPVPIQRTSLYTYKGRQTWDNLTNQIREAKQQKTHHLGLAKGCDYKQQIQKAITQFNLIICDEAHRSIGTVTWEAIREYAAQKDIALLGLTATDAYLDRKLEDYYEKKIHEITLIEAIDMGVINPVAIFTHNTGLRFGGVGIDNYGDYDVPTLREMRQSARRNKLGTDDAKLLTEQGYSGLMSAIPGNNGEHAKVLAELLNQQTVIDPKTGQERQLVADYVLGTMKPSEREKIYRDFELGLIDWIVFVDVIREGWDSDRAKALVNLRPTRSPLLAKQRQGRVGRLSEDGQISIVIDFFDGVDLINENVEIPPVTAVDVFEMDKAEQGFIVGDVDPATVPVIAALRQKLTGTMHAHFSNYIEQLDTALRVNRMGYPVELSRQAGLQFLPYSAVQRTYRGYMPDEFLQAAAGSDNPSVQTVYGRFANDRVGTLYNSRDLDKLIANQPEVNPTKLYTDADGEKWISAEGCKKLLARVAPHASTEDIVTAIAKIEETTDFRFTRQFGKVRLSFLGDHLKFGIVTLFRLEDATKQLAPFLAGK